MQIEPQVTLPLVYQLTDPADSGTYYVRAGIYDSLTRTLIDTVNLTARGSGLFSSSILAPQDPTGFGRHIYVIISVYTDAGYSVFSENYQREQHNYLIKGFATSLGAAGGSEVDYERIGKMLDKSIKQALGAMEPQETDFGPVCAKLDAIAGLVSAIKIPQFKQKEVNLEPTLRQIRATQKAITDSIITIEIPTPEKVDLSPILDSIEKLASEISSMESLSKENKGVLLDAISGVGQTLSKTQMSNDKIREVASMLLGENKLQVEPAPKSPYIENMFPKKL
jgi:hypothetical protein